MSDLALLSATELLKAYAEKSLSPVEVVGAVNDRVARCDGGREGGGVNAFAHYEAEAALAAARAAEARWVKGAPLGALDGVPVTVKDLVLWRGRPTLRGSLTTDPDTLAETDSPPVARFLEAGAVILGKTTTPEFGWKGVGDSPRTGTTRNPWDLTKTTGGSSSGAAAAAAAGFGTIHQGSDGGGSIRIPAGFTGVFGMKPTYGRVAAWPTSPFGTVSHIGPMTRSVSDGALALSVLARPDSRDWMGPTDPAPNYLEGLEDGVRELRVALAFDLGEPNMLDPEIEALTREAAADLRDLGATVEEVALDLSGADECFRVLWFSGAANLLRDFSDQARAQIDEGLATAAAAAERLSALDYLAALNRRDELGATMSRFHDDWDLLITPSLPIPAFDAGLETPPNPSNDPRWVNWTPYSYPFNLTQQPACSIPSGLTAAGLPAGLQIVGRKGADALVLRAARAYETVRPIAAPEL